MNQPNEGMRERWNKYCNKYWKGNVTDNGKTKIVLEVDEDFGYYILDSEIDLALAKQRSEIVEMVKNMKKQEPDSLENYIQNQFAVEHNSTIDVIISTITKDTKD